MRPLRFLLRLAGWLLTPLVAWAASFTGAMLGATLARSTDTALTGVLLTVLVGLVFALLGTHAWLQLVRRNPELRAALQLGPDGAPIVPEPPVDPQPGPAEGDGPG